MSAGLSHGHYLLPAIAGVLSLVGTGLATLWARRTGMLDMPGPRHSHAVPTPRGGGAGAVLALLLVAPLVGLEAPAGRFWLHCLLPGILAMALVGLWDDRISLPARARFAIQVLSAGWLLACADVPAAGGFLFAGFALVAVVWMVNLYNFMDGSNGMAGAQAVFAGTMLAWLFGRAGDPGAQLLSAMLAAAAIGFLPWNLGPRPKVFMGDVGSGTIGFVIAGLLAWGWVSNAFGLSVAWLVMLVFLVDSTLTLSLRVLRGERWYTPHKQHLYQHLIQRGWSHGSVLALYQGINLVLVVPATVVAVGRPESAPFVAMAATVALVLGWARVKSTWSARSGGKEK